MLMTNSTFLSSPQAPQWLRPFFPYYGTKWLTAEKYGVPRYGTIIEPFAGSATYSLKFYDRQVLLVEKDPKIAAMLRYLIRASRREILNLPLLEVGQSIDDLSVCPEARLLVGQWVTRGSSSPRKTMPNTRYAQARNDGSRYACYWGERVRSRLAKQAPHIKHWKVIEGNFTRARNREATWFIDPPYKDAGKHYRQGPDDIDYDALADWCRSRRGQVMVCEQKGADWLPFEFLCVARSNHGRNGHNGTMRTGKSAEVVWRNDG